MPHTCGEAGSSLPGLGRSQNSPSRTLAVRQTAWVVAVEAPVPTTPGPGPEAREELGAAGPGGQGPRGWQTGHLKLLLVPPDPSGQLRASHSDSRVRASFGWGLWRCHLGLSSQPHTPRRGLGSLVQRCRTETPRPRGRTCHSAGLFLPHASPRVPPPPHRQALRGTVWTRVPGQGPRQEARGKPGSTGMRQEPLGAELAWEPELGGGGGRAWREAPEQRGTSAACWETESHRSPGPPRTRSPSAEPRRRT